MRYLNKIKYIIILEFFIFSNVNSQPLSVSPVAPKTRIKVRPSEQYRLFNEKMTFYFKQTSLRDLLSTLGKKLAIHLEVDNNIDARNRKITLACTEMAPAKILVAIAEAYSGEWIRYKKAFRLVPAGQGNDPAENLLTKIEAEINKMFVDSDQSNLNSDDKSLIRGIGFEINKLRMDPPWSQDIFENSVLIRQEQVKRFMGQNTPTVSWGLSSGRNDLVGDLRVGRVAAKWWTYKKKQF